MSDRLRRILFWLHLASGVGAGLVVAVMATTGVALAFDAQIRAWAERGSRAVVVPAGAARLPLETLVRRVQDVRPGAAITAVTIPASPVEAVRVSLGRDDGFHVDPYSGEVRPLSGARTRRLLGALILWHRYLGAAGEGRELGRAITGACNAAFLFLTVSGLILWWPRRWSRQALRASIWFRRGLRGRARDWNWHNVIGSWSMPALLVITFSGLMISYKPVTNLIYTLAGEKPPGAAPAASAVQIAPPPPGARPVPMDDLLANARRAVPGWSSLTVRPTDPARSKDRAPQPVTITVKAPSAGPPFASVQLAFDPYTGRLARADRFADQTQGRRVRTWLRYLHTGEALGWPGQLGAGVVSLGTLVLVFTGFAMALRRLRRGPATSRTAGATRAPSSSPGP